MEIHTGNQFNYYQYEYIYITINITKYFVIVIVSYSGCRFVDAVNIGTAVFGRYWLPGMICRASWVLLLYCTDTNAAVFIWWRCVSGTFFALCAGVLCW